MIGKWNFISIQKYFLISGVCCLLFFYGFSRYVKNGGLKQVDFNMTVKIQERIDKSSRLRLASFVGNVMEGSTFFASPIFSSIAIGILTLIALVRGEAKGIRYKALIIPVFFGLLVLGEIYGKNVVHHPSPPFFMIKSPTSIFPKDYINEQFSYPSGHTARAVFLGIVLYSLFIIPNSFFKRKRFKLLVMIGIMGYIAIVSMSRIYLGHHWLSDIIGGSLLGIGVGLVLSSIFDL